MTKLHHICEDCDSEFSISYNAENCDDDPTFCPFCSSYIIKDDEQIEDE